MATINNNFYYFSPSIDAQKLLQVMWTENHFLWGLHGVSIPFLFPLLDLLFSGGIFSSVISGRDIRRGARAASQDSRVG